MHGDDFKVKPERTGLRDEENILKWHRNILGYNCPMADIDVLLTEEGEPVQSYFEFDNFQPVAFFDYKLEQRHNFLNDGSIKAQKNLANMAGLPFFIVRYRSDLSWFKILAGNDIAKSKLSGVGISNPDEWQGPLTETGYASFCYFLRGRRLPQQVRDRIAARSNAQIAEQFRKGLTGSLPAIGSYLSAEAK